jgi:hypothetical protein
LQGIGSTAVDLSKIKRSIRGYLGKVTSGIHPRNSIISNEFTFLGLFMTEEELQAYQGLKKQGAFLIRSPRFGLVVVSTKLPNLTVTTSFRIPVTTSEYLNRHRFVPTYYQGLDIAKQQIEFCVKNSIKADPKGIIIFRRK